MADFTEEKGYKGPASDLGKSSEREEKGSGVDSYAPLKNGGESKDKRGSDYRGPGSSLK